MGVAQHSAWEAPGFLKQTLRIWLVQLLTVRGPIPPGVRNVLSSWDQQTGGKTVEHMTVNRGGRLVETWLTLPAATQSLGLNILRLKDNKILHQNNFKIKITV